ncbi:hypothetical protein J4476_03670 [Candidatus Woesearchaeota archaeon]|nr:MAG: hypothetical protein QT09_C0007G0005 [archaeon GW2011_AR18]MBS3161766.1 hypothetical protein [Candidatus Woesearchaeota archaeon]HIH25331.1 hypothetical protein [Nanoarchaeota archaeon]
MEEKNQEKSKIKENKHEHEWVRVDGFYALTQVSRKGSQIDFNPSFGVPVIVYVCNKVDCGELKLESAKKKGEF